MDWDEPLMIVAHPCVIAAVATSNTTSSIRDLEPIRAPGHFPIDSTNIEVSLPQFAKGRANTVNDSPWPKALESLQPHPSTICPNRALFLPRRPGNLLAAMGETIKAGSLVLTLAVGTM